MQKHQQQQRTAGAARTHAHPLHTRRLVRPSSTPRVAAVVAAATAAGPAATKQQQKQQQQEAVMLPSTTADRDALRQLDGISVVRSSDFARVELRQLWGADERAVVVWARSLGCPFCQALARELARDVKPQLDAAGVRLFLVSIGTPERSADFAAATGFPREALLVDADAVTYAALGLERGLAHAFFDPRTPLAFLKGRVNPEHFGPIIKKWVPWQPPKGFPQALQQGGCFIFDGHGDCVWSHRDAATADHADVGEVLGVVQRLGARLGEGASCGCGDEAADAAT